MYYDAIDLLKGMISRPSFSREEGETADFLKHGMLSKDFSEEL